MVPFKTNKIGLRDKEYILKKPLHTYRVAVFGDSWTVGSGVKEENIYSSLLEDYYNKDKWQNNQPIILRDLFVLLDKVEGIQTIKSLTISNKAGTTSGYSQYSYDIEGATQNQVIYPSLDPSIFEVKYLDQDIKGKVVPL